MALRKNKAPKRASKYTTLDGHSYLTKRVTLTKARSAGRAASQNAMNVMGYIVVAENNSIVKKFSDGTSEVIAHI